MEDVTSSPKNQASTLDSTPHIPIKSAQARVAEKQRQSIGNMMPSNSQIDPIPILIPVISRSANKPTSAPLNIVEQIKKTCECPYVGCPHHPYIVGVVTAGVAYCNACPYFAFYVLVPKSLRPTFMIMCYVSEVLNYLIRLDVISCLDYIFDELLDTHIFHVLSVFMVIPL